MGKLGSGEVDAHQVWQLLEISVGDFRKIRDGLLELQHQGLQAFGIQEEVYQAIGSCARGRDGASEEDSLSVLPWKFTYQYEVQGTRRVRLFGLGLGIYGRLLTSNADCFFGRQAQGFAFLQEAAVDVWLIRFLVIQVGGFNDL
jgi:hypothetical protein